MYFPLPFLQRFLLIAMLFFWASTAVAQAPPPFVWKASVAKKAAGVYELRFETAGATGWELYAPAQVLSEVAVAEVTLRDSTGVQNGAPFIAEGESKSVQSTLFEQAVSVQPGAAVWKKELRFSGPPPATLFGNLLYSYGRGDEFYNGTYEFSLPLEGGVASGGRILIPAIDLKAPVLPVGDEDVGEKGTGTVFLLGFAAGFLSLLLPCLFPLIPLTVSFFTKKAGSRSRGLFNAAVYGASIVLIFFVLSLPFHLFSFRPETLNNISTNVPLNIFFFVIFVAFAISFFGYFDIALPSGLAGKTDAKASGKSIAGIFFMALTLCIVSFSCTSAVLGALLASSVEGTDAAWKLSAGMTGFGVGLGLPFFFFALFPHWLQGLPKSGGWMNELKVVFGFIELAMAIKFLSNADLVLQWGLLKREVFIGLWIIIGICIVLYLLGIIRFPHDSPRKMSPARLFFVVVFSAITLYLLPGLTNTKWSSLTAISGFPPPMSYSLYHREIRIKPIHNDYESALAKARAEGKPILLDFTGWACVNCRRMEDKVWVDPEVEKLMLDSFVVVSLYVDDRKKLPPGEQVEYTAKNGDKRALITQGDKWSAFQSENFESVSQPQYAMLSPEERLLTKTKSYTPDAGEFAVWLRAGLEANRRVKK